MKLPNFIMNKSSKIIFVILLVLFVVGGFYFLRSNKIFREKATKEKSLTVPSPKPTPTPTSRPKITKEKEETIPKTYKIKNVPFTSQAPFAKWDHDHNEACEEAAILMAHYFYKGESLTPALADKEIIAVINYQKKNWGGHFDLESKEITKLAKEYYGYQNTKIIYDATIEDMKKEIAKGKPVIIPTAGRLLGNPNYKRPGPLYHALVVIGYTEDKIITHDPGTRNGEDYTYSYSTIEKAMHEWNDGKVYSGKKTAIILR